MANQEATRGLNFFQRHAGEIILAGASVVTGTAAAGGVIFTAARIADARAEQSALDALPQAEANQIRNNELAQRINADLWLHVPIEVTLLLVSGATGVYALKKHKKESSEF